MGYARFDFEVDFCPVLSPKKINMPIWDDMAEVFFNWGLCGLFHEAVYIKHIIHLKY